MADLPRPSHWRLLVLASLAALVLCAGCDSAPPQPAAAVAPAETPAPAKREVRLQVVRSDGLRQALADQRGHVVVMDVWGVNCPPCKKEFPHLVELHRKYGPDGLVCLSVCVDELAKKDKALAFLEQQRADFANYLLDEDMKVWQNKWEFKWTPTVLVYGRDGKLARKFDDSDPNHDFSYEVDVEPLVRKLLAEGP